LYMYGCIDYYCERGSRSVDVIFKRSVERERERERERVFQSRIIYIYSVKTSFSRYRK